MKIGVEGRNALVAAAAEKGLYIEGNILKVLEAEGDEAFENYIRVALDKDREARRRRLDVTKQVQEQNAALLAAQDKNAELLTDLREALAAAEGAKAAAEADLDLLQKRTQFELMGMIVKVALAVILGVGVTTTVLYASALFLDKEHTLLGNAWSSMFGILLTNSFSIVGTIMGAKYAAERAAGNKD